MSVTFTVSMKKQSQDSKSILKTLPAKEMVMFAPPPPCTNMKCFYLIKINQRNFVGKFFFLAPSRIHSPRRPCAFCVCKDVTFT